MTKSLIDNLKKKEAKTAAKKNERLRRGLE
jgi:hypothetical protein